MTGGIFIGYISDALGGRRACVIVSNLIILTPLLYYFSLNASSSSSSAAPNAPIPPLEHPDSPIPQVQEGLSGSMVTLLIGLMGFLIGKH